MEKYEVVSFIPARGGSERIPRKNIKMMAGKPMMAWTIEASLKSKYIDRTFVSTEDKEIKGVALEYGAEVIDRPVEFSQGQISVNFALSHFQYCLWEEKYEPDYIIFLHATSPLRTERHIDEAFELYFESDMPLLLSVTPSHHIPLDVYNIDKSGKLVPVLGIASLRHYNKDYRNDHNPPLPMYYDDGVLSIGPYKGTDYFSFAYLKSGMLAYMMDPEDSIDVDTPLDFKVAEMLLEERIKGRR